MASNDDLLFAEHAVRLGFLIQQEVDESLEVQARMAEMGVREALRDVLVKRGLLRAVDAGVIAKKAGLDTGREPIPGYTLLKRVGSGAMGSVYKAYQKGMKRHVAVKVLRRDLTDDPRQVERLQREAALVGKLDHPNIVRGLDSGDAGGLVWFVMEHVEGETLQTRIRRDGPVDLGIALDITRQIADALDHAHSHGVVHRDVKPGNILLAEDGATPRLTDYGLAKGESEDPLTQIDATLGTPQYISPEQARNPRDADIRSDIYSLGATLYAMLTGRPPFEGDTVAEILTKVLYERPPALGSLAADTPRPVVYVVQRMMAKERRLRYGAPADLLRDLDALERGRLQVPAGFRGDIEEFDESRRHRRRMLTGLGIVAVVTVLALGVLWWQNRQTRLLHEEGASRALTAIRANPGAPSAWDGSTVERMVGDLESWLGRYGDTPSRRRAAEDLVRWRREETALLRVQDLVRGHDAGEPVWPRAVGATRAELARLQEEPDATVARRRMERHLADLRGRREKRVREVAAAAALEAAALPLRAAQQRWEALAARLRGDFYGQEDADPVTNAERSAVAFAETADRIDGHFEAYERTLGELGGVASGAFAEFARALEAAAAAARSDVQLRELLAALPPRGSRTVAVVDERRDLKLQTLRVACAGEWAAVRSATAELRSQGRYDEALVLVGDFAARALDPHARSAERVREEVAGERDEERRRLVEMMTDTMERFLEHYGRREYGQAADQLLLLQHELDRRHGDDGGAAGQVTAARRLLELTEARVWVPFRRRLTTVGAGERGIRLGTIGCQPDGPIRIEGDRISFSQRGSPFSGSVRDVSLDDVLHHAGLQPSDAPSALVCAAMRVTELDTADPRRALLALRAEQPSLQLAGEDPELRPVVDLVFQLTVSTAAQLQGEIAEVERQVEELHRRAREALAAGDPGAATPSLQRLLRLRNYARTEYVRRHREQIQAELDEARRGEEVGDFQARLPGRLLQRPDGSAEYGFDFEDPAILDALRLNPGRFAVEARSLPVAAGPAPASGTEAVVADRALRWTPWDGRPENHPGRFAAEFNAPFEPRRRITVEFRYRSDQPFFLLVSIGGANAGILSAEDVREGGRGVSIWSGHDLTSPENGFSDRHRTPYLLRHPEALEREGETTFFRFRPGRVYRVRFVREEREAVLSVDGRERARAVFSGESGPLDWKVALLSYTSGEVDDLRISGILDPDWLR